MTISVGALAAVLSVVDRMDFRNEVYYQARMLIHVCILQFHITPLLHGASDVQGPLLLTWINLNPSMDK